MRRITFGRKQRGQAMIESVLTLMIIVMLMIGALDLAQVFFIHQSLAERTRLTARYASLNYNAPDGVRNYFLYGRPDPPDAYQATFLSVQPSMVSVTRLDADTNSDRMEVKVHDYPYRFVTPYISGAYTGKPIIATAMSETRSGW
jgi:Tfp pilus assembly protein PilV